MKALKHLPESIFFVLFWGQASNDPRAALHLLDELSLQSLFPLSPFPHLKSSAYPASPGDHYQTSQGHVHRGVYWYSPRCKGLGTLQRNKTENKQEPCKNTIFDIKKTMNSHQGKGSEVCWASCQYGKGYVVLILNCKMRVGSLWF